MRTVIIITNDVVARLKQTFDHCITKDVLQQTPWGHFVAFWTKNGSTVLILVDIYYTSRYT